MTTANTTEATLLKPSINALIGAEVLDKNDVCAQEVPVIGNSVDVVCIRARDSTLIGIELKLNNWARVNDQAKRHGAWAHRTYVAVNSKSVPRIYRKIYSALGIGIILTKTDPVTIYKRSPKTNISSRHLSRLVRAYVREYGRPISSFK